MSAAQKFLFDRTFEVPEEPQDIPTPETQEPEQPEEPEIVVPTFSEEDVEAARQEGFAAGREEGIREATGTFEKQAVDTFERLEQLLPDLFNSLREIRESSTQIGISVAAAMARKLLPDMASRNALGEFERMIGEVLERISEEPRLTIRVNAEMAEEIKGKVERMLADKGFNGNAVVTVDDAMPTGDCRLEWANGGAIRDHASLWKEIDDIIAANLGAEARDFARSERGTALPGDEKPIANTEEPAAQADPGTDQDIVPPAGDEQGFVANQGTGDNEMNMPIEETEMPNDETPGADGGADMPAPDTHEGAPTTNADDTTAADEAPNTQ